MEECLNYKVSVLCPLTDTLLNVTETKRQKNDLNVKCQLTQKNPPQQDSNWEDLKVLSAKLNTVNNINKEQRVHNQN